MKNLLQNQEFPLDEILFQGRNKDYGAYVIRNESGNTMFKAMFVGVAFFATIAITPLIINSFRATKTIEAPPKVEIELINVIDPPIKKPEIVKTTTPVAPPKVNTYDSQVATPKRDANESVTKDPPKDSDAVLGTENIVGLPPTKITKPPVINVVVPPEIKKPVIEDTRIPKNVDVEASFNGGINAFRSKVVQNFDTGSFEGSGDLMKTTITFIVEKDGTISGVKANGPNSAFNKEAEATIKNIKGKWFPAKLGGNNVRSYFNFPISMQFE